MVCQISLETSTLDSLDYVISMLFFYMWTGAAGPSAMSSDTDSGDDDGDCMTPPAAEDVATDCSDEEHEFQSSSQSHQLTSRTASRGDALLPVKGMIHYISLVLTVDS